MTPAKFRPLTFGVTRVALRDGAPGAHYLSAEQPLHDYPERITDRLQQWATTTPEQTFIARREKRAGGGTGDAVDHEHSQQTAETRSREGQA